MLAPFDRTHAGFPYPRPYERLPWQPIAAQTDLPLDAWVWVADRLYNIYPAARTERGLEVPGHLNLQDMQKAGLLDRPRYWLPFTPDSVDALLQQMPRIFRSMRPAHG